MLERGSNLSATSPSLRGLRAGETEHIPLAKLAPTALEIGPRLNQQSLGLERIPYSTDLTDNKWHVIAPLLPGSDQPGRPRKYSWRDILNAVLYVLWTGCQRRACHMTSRSGKWPITTCGCGAGMGRGNGFATNYAHTSRWCWGESPSRVSESLQGSDICGNIPSPSRASAAAA